MRPPTSVRSLRSSLAQEVSPTNFRDLLSSELAEAQSELVALRGRLKGIREATAELRHRDAVEATEAPRRLARSEELAAEHCRTHQELWHLQHSLEQVDQI